MSLSRAGHLNCECPAPSEGPAAGLASRGETMLLASGFGLSTLAQALVIAALPYAANILAPNAPWRSAAYAAWLIGALLATFPASMLSGLFGRRAAFALGGSLGLAGGVLAAWSFAAGQFPALIIGALWLGLAQGFGLFYRHAAAANRGSGLAGLFAAGALAVLAAPALTQTLSANSALGPSWLFLAASLVSLASIAIALILPEAAHPNSGIVSVRIAPSLFFTTALASALAWFVMTALMGATPALLAGCGYGAGAAAGLIAWHMLAMYLPAALIAPVAERIGQSRLTALGLTLLIAALGLAMFWQTLAPITTAMTMAGCGWSLVTMSSMIRLHAQGSPSRMIIAGHDALVFSGAILGAFAYGLLA